MRRNVQLLALFLAATCAVARGDDAWTQLKLGMTADDAAAKLGRPLLRARGRGFEVWTYNQGAEVLLYGSLIGWTAPGSGRVRDRSMDVWRAADTRAYFPTFTALLPKPPPRVARNAAKAESADGPSGTFRLPVPVYRRW